MLKHSEFILNPDGSIYHLHLKPGQISKHIITVGDIERVEAVTRHFDSIELSVQNREFKTVTGSKNGVRLSVVSTGIGTDNIDIVFNELDALVNVDFPSRKIKNEHTQLHFYRIGTSGTLREEIPVDSLLLSAYGVDLGNLSSYYHYDHPTSNVKLIQAALNTLLPGNTVIEGALDILSHFNANGDYLCGITFTAPGFYAPQGRSIRLASKLPSFDALAKLDINGYQITNLEMETSGIYLLAHLLGHKALSCNALLANRSTGHFSANPAKTVDKLIDLTLSKIVDYAAI